MFSASDAPDLFHGPDHVITADQADLACREGHKLTDHVGFIVMTDPDYPDQIIARLAVGRMTRCLLVAGDLTEIAEMMPEGMARADRHPEDPPQVVAHWSATRIGPTLH